MSALQTVIVPINTAGYPFIAAFAIVAFLLSFVAGELGWIGFILTAWCVYFFRDPPRVVPQDPNFLISPADGTVVKIEKVMPPAELEMGSDRLTCVSVFLNVFDVHVNRAPCAGKILKKSYRPGKFMNAAFDKASTDNERMAIKLLHESGKEIAFVQIAGWVARRIICDVDEGDFVLAGQRYGLIRFGSRADLYLPEGIEPQVIIGQKMVAGETVIANLEGPQLARFGDKI
ncbi:MAG: phosphatidylserine decarboxylase [Alphaproteobacteria bacterium]|jgi:phosphatidylserine decarboxylase|nr:phosphatidylserine decarboxylase [Alphaproteobacteria bacterium]MBP9877897.1 phosphatidylserine decarboxylase [Alphaproteobacteria bacterium]